MTGVTIEAWRGKQGPAQCHRCQSFRHSSVNCHKRMACVRCAGEHRAADCTRPKDVPATCANYGGPHPACHSTCPVRKEEERNRRSGTCARTAPSGPLRQRRNNPSNIQHPPAVAPLTSGVAPTVDEEGFVTVRRRTRRGGRKRGPAAPSLAAQEAGRAAALHTVSVDVANRAAAPASAPSLPRMAPPPRSRTSSQDIDVALVSETHLTAASRLRKYQVYRQHHVDTTGRAYRDLAVMVRRRIPHRLLPDVAVTECSALGVELQLADRPTGFFAVYAAGDWNEKHPSWNSRIANKRGPVDKYEPLAASRPTEREPIIRPVWMLSRALPVFHALTGCDFNPAFTRYIANLWRNAYKSDVTDLEPTDHGWNENNNKFEFTWFIGNPLPDAYENVVVSPDILANENDTEDSNDETLDSKILIVDKEPQYESSSEEEEDELY
ncbi:unnamed protein product [Pieris macdunnoughi]|uniref:Endonuclease/exonuclease/phosphatase domain-containing protein n=1 Tax=Pieris macdunnoughi TaxID=345717 RepID=A0A821XNH0_9NEOP|nr:unnamed protein product [Pieris macdunnoughi]